MGKSTLINTIFASHLIDSKGRLASEEAVRKTTEIQAASHGMFCSCQSNENENECFAVGLVFDAPPFFMLWHFFLRILKGEFNADVCFTVIVENGVRLRLNIVDTPGYGDQVNNEGWCVPSSLY